MVVRINPLISFLLVIVLICPGLYYYSSFKDNRSSSKVNFPSRGSSSSGQDQIQGQGQNTSMTPFRAVFVTVPSLEVAKKLARYLQF